NSKDSQLIKDLPQLYLPMIETADIVAARYGISREDQDEYALRSQQLTAAAQREGRYADEIIQVQTTMRVTDRETGESHEQEVTADTDNCNRPSTTLEALAGLKPIMGEDKFITAGNASQLADGVAACVVMEAKEAERANLEPLGAFHGFAGAGCHAVEMGLGRVVAGPKFGK